MSRSRSPKDEYGRGYADGIRHAEHEREDGILGAITDLINDPRYDSKGSSAYQEGFKDGRKDG